MNNKTLALAAVLIGLPALTLSSGAFAQMNHDHHGASKAPSGAADAPSTKGLEDANAKMHKDMDITFSGNADVDFVRGMIPHHQGAIDMAKVVLQYGKDPDVKKLAADIIKAQESEIAWMQDWLKKNAK
jgi:uncharacterized protein (DUF305 family)